VGANCATGACVGLKVLVGLELIVAETAVGGKGKSETAIGRSVGVRVGKTTWVAVALAVAEAVALGCTSAVATG
jgi:hypothetical protein